MVTYRYHILSFPLSSPFMWCCDDECCNHSLFVFRLPQTYERQSRMPEQREGGLLQLLGDPSPAKHQPRNALLPAPTLSPVQPLQHTPTQQFQHVQQHQVSPDWITFRAPSVSPANPTDSGPAVELTGASRSANSLMDPNAPFPRTATHSHSPQRCLTPDLQLPVVTDASILNLTSLSRYLPWHCFNTLQCRNCNVFIKFTSLTSEDYWPQGKMLPKINECKTD